VNTVKVRLFRARGRIMEAYRRRMATGRKPGISPSVERKA
jgi:hypothetical protein